jgi:hypothetical protein
MPLRSRPTEQGYVSPSGGQLVIYDDLSIQSRCAAEILRAALPGVRLYRGGHGRVPPAESLEPYAVIAVGILMEDVLCFDRDEIRQSWGLVSDEGLPWAYGLLAAYDRNICLGMWARPCSPGAEVWKTIRDEAVARVIWQEGEIIGRYLDFCTRRGWCPR